MDGKIIVKRLSILWLTLFLVGGIISIIYRVTQMFSGNYNDLALFSTYHYIVILFVLLISTPLLLIIRHYSSITRLKAILIISTGILVQHGIWLMLCIIKWIDRL